MKKTALYRSVRAASWVAWTAAALCGTQAVAQSSWTTGATVGAIQSLSSGTPASGATTHYFRSGQTARWTVNSGNGCSSPYFVYLDSLQFGYRELLATVMLAKALGKPVYFIGECTSADYFRTNYVILLE